MPKRTPKKNPSQHSSLVAHWILVSGDQEQNLLYSTLNKRIKSFKVHHSGPNIYLKILSAVENIEKPRFDQYLRLIISSLPQHWMGNVCK